MKKILLVFFSNLISFSLYCISNFDGVCNVYNTSNCNINEQIYQYEGFRDTWSNIVQIGYYDKSYILFYDRYNGAGTLVDVTSGEKIKNYSNWSKKIRYIISIDIEKDGIDELLFYYPANGICELFKLNSRLDLVKLSSFSLGISLKSIFVLNIDNDNKLVCYDQISGTCKIYKIDLSFNWTLASSFKGWRKSWKILCPVSFGSLKALLCYDYNGYLEIISFDSPNSFNSLVKTVVPKNITKIVSGNFDSNGNGSDILMYSQSLGKAYFYQIKDNRCTLKNTNTQFRKTWSIIFPIKIKNQTDNLLFYETLNNAELDIPVPDCYNQVVHPDILLTDSGTYKLAITPYFCGNEMFENPTYLESFDGFSFYQPLGISSPLANKPKTSTTFPRTYNDDVDISSFNGTDYIIYQETFRNDSTGAFVQNIFLMESKNSWNSFSKKKLFSESSDSLTYSPTIIQKNDTFFMFFINKKNIRFLTSTNIHDWNWKPNDIVMDDNGEKCNPWHVDIIKNPYDNYYYLLICGKKFFSSSSVVNDLYLAKSSDLRKWYLFPKPILQKDEYDCTQIYRSTGFFENATTLSIWYSFLRNNKEWNVGIRRHLNIVEDTTIVKEQLYRDSSRMILTTLNSPKTFFFSIYPNPCIDFVYLSFGSLDFRGKDVKILVYNSLGKLMKEFKEQTIAGSLFTRLNLSDLKNGNYFINILGDNLKLSRQIAIYR